MGVHFGRDAKLYYNTSGDYNAPTWTAIPAIRDVQIPDGERVRLDGSARDYGIELAEPGNLKFSIEFKIRTNESDTTFAALETAALLSPAASGSVLDIMILTGGSTTNGNRGFRMDMKIHKFFGEDQNIDQILWRPVRLEPCVPTNSPKSVVVSGGAPVFTALAL